MFFPMLNLTLFAVTYYTISYTINPITESMHSLETIRNNYLPIGDQYQYCTKCVGIYKHRPHSAPKLTCNNKTNYNVRNIFEASLCHNYHNRYNYDPPPHRHPHYLLTLSIYFRNNLQVSILRRSTTTTPSK